MHIIHNAVIFSVLSLSLSAYSKSEEFKVIDLSTASKTVYLPQELIRKVESQNKEFKEKKLFQIRVQLIEKANRALQGQNIELVMPEGGGRIDLAEYVKGTSGSFYVKVLPSDQVDAKKVNVYFLSNSVKRNLEGTHWGSGCDKFFDVTSIFRKQFFKGGLLVFNTYERFVSVLAGTYVFASAEEGILHLSQLTLMDSRHMNLQCPRN